MTFGHLWESTSSSPYYNGYPNRYHESLYYAGERGDTGGYSYGHTTAPKSKKAEKKQAAMSALTLIAFLFFLNILQNCLREHNDEETTSIMMVGQSSAEGRDPNEVEDQGFQDKVDNEATGVLKTRQLLSVDDEESRDSARNFRKSKFIHDFGDGARDWTNELSQVTDEDLVGQKQKLDQLRQLWNNHKVKHEGPKSIKKWKPGLEEEVERVKVKKFINNPVLSDVKSIPKLSQYWAAQKTTTEPTETKYVEFEEPKKKVADFHEFEVLSGASPALSDMENSIVHNAATSLHLHQPPPNKQEEVVEEQYFISSTVSTTTDISGKYSEETAAPMIRNWDHLESKKTTEKSLPSTNIQGQLLFEPRAPVGQAVPVSDPYGAIDDLNTPRYRRSDEQLTTLPTEGLFFPENHHITQNSRSEPSTTTKTYHVYTHPAQIVSNMWQTTTHPAPTTTPATTETHTTEKMDIDKIYLTTLRPMPSKNYPLNRHPPNHRPQYRPAIRYQDSPYRRVSLDQPLVRQEYNPTPLSRQPPPRLRHEYYPMSVVGQYGGDDESTGLGLLQLVWTLVSSFAKPIVRLVPNLSKVGGDARCLDLLACEAHRVGDYMGPTAQALANTFSSVLKWIIPESDKATLEEAVADARENSCLRQIQACDDRSGGKSAITVVAKLMEIKPDRKAKLPRSNDFVLTNS